MELAAARREDRWDERNEKDIRVRVGCELPLVFDAFCRGCHVEDEVDGGDLSAIHYRRAVGADATRTARIEQDAHMPAR